VTNGVTIGATLGVTIGVEAFAGTRVTLGVTNAEAAFGVKSVILGVADSVSSGVLLWVVIAVSIGVSIGEKNRKIVKMKKKKNEEKCRKPRDPLQYVIMKLKLQCMNRWRCLTLSGTAE
jgi:hypothetical protein